MVQARTTGSRATLAGAVVLGAWALAPIHLLSALARLGVTVALAPLLPWLLIVYPHVWLVRRSGYAAQFVLPGLWAPSVAVLQWTLVALVFGALLRRAPLRTKLWAAPLVVVAVGLLFHLIVSAAGVTVEADWL